jgi:hypothetical protein
VCAFFQCCICCREITEVKQGFKLISGGVNLKLYRKAEDHFPEGWAQEEQAEKSKAEEAQKAAEQKEQAETSEAEAKQATEQKEQAETSKAEEAQKAAATPVVDVPAPTLVAVSAEPRTKAVVAVSVEPRTKAVVAVSVQPRTKAVVAVSVEPSTKAGWLERGETIAGIDELMSRWREEVEAISAMDARTLEGGVRNMQTAADATAQDADGTTHAVLSFLLEYTKFCLAAI